MEGTQRGRERLRSVPGGLSRVTDSFVVLTVAMISQEDTQIKVDRSVCLQCVQLPVCQLHPHKAVKKTKHTHACSDKISEGMH